MLATGRWSMHPTTLSQDAQSTFLRGLVERVRSLRRGGSSSPLVVFDLDGTLLDNRPRSVAILRELSSQWAERYPAEARAIAACKPEELAYAMSDSLARLGVAQPGLIDEGLQFWRDRFFRDAYLVHDIEVAGAVRFARAVYDAGANLVYLTGRDLPLMGLGSWTSLRDLGFPIGVVGTELVCKPQAELHDETFKRDVAPTLGRLGEVVASFDNEPANCNLFLEAHPRAAAVFLDTQHSADAPSLSAGVMSLRDLRFSP